MNSELIENNFLISQFNGWTYQNVDEFIKDRSSSELHNYQEDWNKLMPVIEKIEELGYSVNINGLAFHIEKPNGELICYSKLFEDKKATCYSAVKSFVRWYKTQAVSTK